MAVEIPLPADLERRIAQHRRREITTEGLIPAAVAVPLMRSADGSLRLLFTLRTDRVEHHKGEISFPGGRTDPDDEDAVATALRETWEEIGIPSKALRPIGALDDFVSITGYRVTPVVVIADEPVALTPQPTEVADILAVPLDHLLDPAHHSPPETHSDRHYHTFHWNGHRIWGLTGNILHHFLSLAFSMPKAEEPSPLAGFDRFVQLDRESHELLRQYHRWLLENTDRAPDPKTAGDFAHAADRYLRDFVVDVLEWPPLASNAHSVRAYLANWYVIHTLIPTHEEIDRIARALLLLHEFLSSTGQLPASTLSGVAQSLQDMNFFHQRLESFWALTPETIAPWRAVCDYRPAHPRQRQLQ